MEEIKIMDDNTEKVTDSNSKDKGPLQARVDDLYRDLFDEELEKHPEMKKKRLMEEMIYSYVRNREKSEQEKLLSFSGEINLIATELDNILRIFKNIASKSQDTVGSQKNYYEQAIKNVNDQLEAAKLSINNLSEKNKLLEDDNNRLKLQIDGLLETEAAFKSSSDKKDNQIKDLKIKSNDLLEEIRALKNVEKENVQLSNELSKSSETIKKLESMSYDKDSELHKLNLKATELTETITSLKRTHAEELKDIKSKHQDDIKDIETKICKELELDKKSELLDQQQRYNELQMKYNDLQVEHMKTLNEISNNKKSSSLKDEK